MEENCGILLSDTLRGAKRKSFYQECPWLEAGSFRKKNTGKEELVEWATETGSYLAEHLIRVYEL